MYFARTAIEILDEIRLLKGLGSDGALGEALGIRQSTVSSWRARNSLPYDVIINFCIKEGISTDALFLRQGPVAITKAGTVPHDAVTIAIDDLFTTRLQRELGERTVDWLAAESGVDAARIEEIISGQELPTIDELESIADALKVGMSWLAQRSTISSENWMFEFFKKGGKAVFPAEIFKAYLLAAESYIEKMQGLVKLSPELKADVITTACRVHMKETPNSTEVNPELIRYLLMLPR
jgi:transcriptional regulator with XRE-family HTH domain